MTYVEHPKTPTPIRGLIPKATAFSLAGGTMHFNKCDCMVVMHRIKDDENKIIKTDIKISIIELYLYSA